MLFALTALCPAQSYSGALQLTGTAVGGVAIKVETSANSPSLPSTASIERAAFDLINKERAANGDAPLVWSEKAAEVARTHSLDMANGQFFSHRGTDGSMVDDRAGRAGINDWQAISENIAYVRGVEDPIGFAVAKWMASPSHRKNLLDKRWKESAIGVAALPDGTIYFTQVFILRF